MREPLPSQQEHATGSKGTARETAPELPTSSIAQGLGTLIDVPVEAPMQARHGVVQRRLSEEVLTGWSLLELIEPRYKFGYYNPADDFLKAARAYLELRPALFRGPLAGHLDELDKVKKAWRGMRTVLAQDFGDQGKAYDKIELRMHGMMTHILEDEEWAKKELAVPDELEEEEDTGQGFDLDDEYKGLTVRDLSGTMIAELDGVDLPRSRIYEDKEASPAQIKPAWVEKLANETIPDKVKAIYTRGATVRTRDKVDKFSVPPIESLRALQTFVIRFKGTYEEPQHALFRGMLGTLTESHGNYFYFKYQTDSGIEDGLASEEPSNEEARI